MTHTWNGGPVADRSLGRPHKLWWTHWDEGITLARDSDGVWHELRGATDAALTAYTYALRGGYTATVSDTYYNELVAAGYGAYFI